MPAGGRSRRWGIARGRPARPGVALVIVMVAVAVAMVLALSFQSVSSTTVPIAQNADRHTSARAVAESALAMAVKHVRTSGGWRSEFAAGALPVDQAFGPGTFTLSVEDGEDLNGDGVISGAEETDGDLSDDSGDPVTLTVLARVDNVVHRVQAVVHPAVTGSTLRVLWVVRDPSDLDGDEEHLREVMQDLGWTVTAIDDGANQAQFNEALADADVVFVNEDASGSSVDDRIENLSIGIVISERDQGDDFDLAADRSTTTDNRVDVVNTSHEVMAGLSSGVLTIAAGTEPMECLRGSLAPGATVLAERPGSSDVMLMVVEKAGALLNTRVAPGRRAYLALTNFEQGTALNEAGRGLLERTVAWAAATPPAQQGVLCRWFDVSSGLSELSQIDWTTTPTGVTTAPDVNWSSTNGSLYTGGPSETFGLLITAKINIPTEGSWTFYTDSDDGSDLVIDGVTIVDNDGLHAMRERSGTVTLTAGWHQLTSRLFENGGRVGHILRWQGPGVSKQVVPSSALQVWFGEADAEAGDDEEGELPEPVAIARYDFETPDMVQPQLVAHWKLDDSGTGGGVSVGDRVTLQNTARIDAYRAADGAYALGTALPQAAVSTNATGGGKITLSSQATIQGDALVGAGGNPSSVITTYNTATVTGSRTAQGSNASVSTAQSPPGGLTNQGDANINGGNTTLNTNYKVNNATLNNGARITVSGHRRLEVAGNFTLNDGYIDIPSGSSLALYVAGNLTLNSNSYINNDTTGTGRLSLHMHGSGKDLTCNGNNTIVGSVRGSDDLFLHNASHIYGLYTGGGDVTISSSGGIHVDLGLPATASPVAVDSYADHDGRANGGVTFGQSAPIPGTAAAFDGSNDFVAVPHDNAFLLNEGTISFWFYPQRTSGTQGLVTKDSTMGDTGGHCSFHLEGNRVWFRMQKPDNTSYIITSSNTVSTNQWYHVTGTFGPAGMKLYVNGELVGTNSWTGGMGTTSGGAGNFEPWVFGCASWVSDDLSTNNWSDPFRGRLDDIRVYSTVLDETQIGHLADGDEPGATVPPTVPDTSGYGDALDLTITDPARVTWLEDNAGLRIDSATRIASADPADKITDRVGVTGQVTVEVVFTPLNTSQNGPARIATLSPDSYNRNVMVGQDGTRITGRLRTTDTGSNGTPDLDGNATVTVARQHVILTFDGDHLRLYRNGSLEATDERPGDLSNWNDAYRLVLGNELADNVPWRGTFHQLIIWDRGMNGSQASNRFNGLDPGNGATSASAFTVRWLE